MRPIRNIEAPIVVYAQDDVDTDQIIPARFLAGTSRDGLGRYAFIDLRARPGFPAAAFESRQPFVLVAGRNFGCGSSREHAVWALQDAGVQAVIAPSFGDIFRRNATANGLLLATVEASDVTRLNPDDVSRVVVDLERNHVRINDRTVPFSIDAFARRCLLEGVDELGYLLARNVVIERFERTHRIGPTTRRVKGVVA